MDDGTMASLWAAISQYETVRDSVQEAKAWNLWHTHLFGTYFGW